ncbi:MAG: insulinase family protein [Chitinophagaceae bacterium]|jgi:predicted Zn-dependent peptidase|nr:insulinase family protein [Chitinophagaceae bacterium]HRG81875.1 pitrilysin family protein [Chitinophagaceae bacterium]HRG91580.1 pitrilysin family protein [Chitinophagaceae bacterium]
MPDRKQAPVIVDAVDFDLRLKQAEKIVLNNGVEVYAVNAGAEEVMSVEWVFYAGNWFEDKNLVAATSNFLLRNGTSSKTAFQLNEHFEYYGAYLNRACYNETATITLHCLNKHIQELLPVVRELITDSLMPQEELDTYRQNMMQRLKVNLKKSDFVASRLIDAYVYGEQHPYGKYTRLEDFDTLNREELIAFYKQYYQQGKFVMFIAGRLPSGWQEQINHYFGDLPNNGGDMNNISKDPLAEKKSRIINDAEGVQGSIRMARPFYNRHHPDFVKAMVLNTLFGGFFGSRLMSNIREDKGYTYGIHSFLQNHIHDSAWVISTEAGKDVCEATIEEVYKEMKILREELVDEEELLLVRNYMMGSILGDLDGPFQIMARWKNIVLNNLTDQYFYDSIQTIKTISAAELQALAQQYLRPEDFYELVVV